jgi:uncharacterized protein YecE (DUF72 family)
MIKIGTCSWKYPSWHRLVYSAPEKINYLAEYARRFNTVEIDQWFWSLFGIDKVTLPRPEVVKAYRQAVPDDFRFTVKVPNSITLTHLYRKRKDDPLVPNPHFLSPALLRSFLNLIEPLQDVLGALLFQFEYLNLQKMSSRKDFLEQLEAFGATVPPSWSCAVEVRNTKYFTGDYFDLLRRIGLSPVLLEGYWMPPIAEVFRQYEKEISAHDLIVIRLHGPDRRKIEQQTKKRWDRIVAARDEELAEIAKMVKYLADHETDVYVNVNNHYEGSAPLTIEKLQGLLGA